MCFCIETKHLGMMVGENERSKLNIFKIDKKIL